MKNPKEYDASALSSIAHSNYCSNNISSEIHVTLEDKNKNDKTMSAEEETSQENESVISQPIYQ